MKKTSELLILFIIGGLVYNGLELMWRGYSHWTMSILGGLSFIIIGLINEVVDKKMLIQKQMLLGCIVITSVELLCGMICNYWLKMNIWDYSNLPFNLYGQICLYASILWYFLSLFAIWLDDICMLILFKRPFPKYRIK